MSYPTTIKECEDYILGLVNQAGDGEVCISIKSKAMLKARNELLRRGDVEVAHHDPQTGISYLRPVVGPRKLREAQVRRLFAPYYRELATSATFYVKRTTKREEWAYFVLRLVEQGLLPDSALNWKCPRSIRNYIED
jgi:hypothetical protein